MKLLLVVLAGGAGSGARYLVALGLADLAPRLPLGTFTVNVVGCFLMSLLQELALRLGKFPEELRLLLTTGFLGGFTTYSSFHHETLTLARGNTPIMAVAYVVATLVLGFLAGLGGLFVARAF